MRIWFWAVVALSIWALAVQIEKGPAPRGADALAKDFSAARAKAALSRVLGPERPHPAGSAENAALQGRLMKELSALGVKATSFTRMSCYGEARWHAIQCGTVGNVIAPVMPGPRNDSRAPAIVLMAHLDSVAAGPGAGDDGSGLATVLETIRALKASAAPSRHPVIALFTDGEEDGLLGAAAFVRDPAWRARVGMVVNVDARGDQGSSLLFQTSAGDAALIDLYAASVPHPATSSLYAEIYKVLPNDTDMTPVLAAGLPGFNFANVGHVAAYHTALDTLANLDPRTLQSHGDNVLGLTRGLMQSDFARLKSGGAIYLDVMGLWLPRLPLAWALPLSLLTLLAIALTGWVTRQPGAGRRAIALVMPPALVLGAAAAGFALQGIAARISGNPDPAFAQPLALRIALALGVWAIALVAARRATLASSWLWLSALGVAAAWFAPGASPYFLFPSLVAAASLPFAMQRPWLAALPALAFLLLWLPLATGVETLLGLAQAFVFADAVAMALIPLLPLLQPRRWRAALACGGAALLAATAAGFVPSFDAGHPQRLNILYTEENGHARLIASPVAVLPDSLRMAAHFSPGPERGLERGYVAPLGAARLPPPSARISRHGDMVVLDWNGQGGIMLVVPAAAGLKSAAVNQVRQAAAAGQTVINCATPDCSHAHVDLEIAGVAPFALLLVERRAGLPPQAASIARARPATAMQSQAGDLTLLATRLDIPGR